MLHCDIAGCGAWTSEVLMPEETAKWFIARPEQVNEAKMLALENQSRGFGTRVEKLLSRWLGREAHVQDLEQVWPNLDWWMLGGVERIVLCPRHKLLVAAEVIKLRSQDPSMNPERPTPGNRS